MDETNQGDSIDPRTLQSMERNNIDIERSLSILNAYNAGDFDHFAPVTVSEIPEVDGTTIVDFTSSPGLTLPLEDARRRLAHLIPEHVHSRIGSKIGTPSESRVSFSNSELNRLGLLLLPTVAYGVLNGGSATSYVDTNRNSSFSPELLRLLQKEFELLSDVSHGRPKGLTPAFLQPDGSLGPTFLQLKMRGILILSLRCQAAWHGVAGGSGLTQRTEASPLTPFFQMTSVHTDQELATAYDNYRTDPLLADLILETGTDPTQAVGAVQPLISAYTHSEAGRTKSIFTRAYGRDCETLALPGGHGQCFSTLGPTFQSLRGAGKRFVYLGNVDNLGFLPDPVEIAYLALTGRQAGFDFAFKTPVDVKGGILVRDQSGGLTCADIGPAITREEVEGAAESGHSILFNAASGLFDLDFLVPRIDQIAKDLPTRFTDQDKDAGKYSQAEQVTWEVVGMLDDLLVFSVEKWDRLLAAKILLETLMTSGVKLNDAGYPTDISPASDLRGIARALHRGLTRKLESEYGMRLEGGRWVPVPAQELLEAAR